jgi:hypothetical protein
MCIFAYIYTNKYTYIDDIIINSGKTAQRQGFQIKYCFSFKCFRKKHSELAKGVVII